MEPIIIKIDMILKRDLQWFLENKEVTEFGISQKGIPNIIFKKE